MVWCVGHLLGTIKGCQDPEPGDGATVSQVYYNQEWHQRTTEEIQQETQEIVNIHIFIFTYRKIHLTIFLLFSYVILFLTILSVFFMFVQIFSQTCSPAQPAGFPLEVPPSCPGFQASSMLAFQRFHPHVQGFRLPTCLLSRGSTHMSRVSGFLQTWIFPFYHSTQHLLFVVFHCSEVLASPR